jgi:hypothetical protein
MQLNLKTKLLSVEGSPLLDITYNEKNEKVEKEVSLKNLIILALRQPIEGEKEKSIKDSDFLILCKFLVTNDLVELTSEDISRIKLKSSYFFDCFVAGQIGLILEDKPLQF